MAAPTFVAEYETSWSTTTTPKTASVTVAVGDVLVLAIIAEGTSGNFGTPTGGTGFTWVVAQSHIVASNVEMHVYTTTATVAQTFTLSIANSGAAQTFGFNCLRLSGSTGVGTSTKAQGTGAPSLAITPTGANSALVVFAGDWNAVDGASRTWRTGAGALTEQSYYSNPGSTYTIYGGFHADAGAIAAKTVGLTAPTGQKYSIIAVEVLAGSGGGTNYTQTISDTIGATDAVARVTTQDRAVADQLGLLDAALTSAAVNYVSSVGDTLGATDAASSELASDRVVADALDLVDAGTSAMSITLAPPGNDPMGLTDAVSAAVGAVRGQLDVAGLTDAAAATLDASRGTSDVAALTDATTSALDASRGTADTAGLTDVTSAVLDVARGIADIVEMTDSVTVTLTSVGSTAIGDVLDLGDSTTTTLAADRSVGDLAGLVDAVSVERHIEVTISDGIGLVDQASAPPRDIPVFSVRTLREVTRAKTMTDVTTAKTLIEVTQPHKITEL